MTIRHILIFVVAMVFGFSAIACSGKPRAKEMELGISLTERAVNYTLQGQTKMADFTYNRAVAKFRDMGKFCDMSRVAIIMYTIDNFTNNQALSDAKAFATLGECPEEMNIVNFVSGSTYNISTLAEPYKAFAEYVKTGMIIYLKSLASSSSTSDRIKSLTYRYMANELLDKDPSLSIKYANEAKRIDEKGAWTRNLLADENIILQATENLGLATDIVKGRISVLQKAMSEKY